jgi:eukaryotic-like serine/threonine-protein kinase
LTIPSGTTLGRYEIRSKLGAGGMGEVYLAQDTSELARTVALKIVPAEVAQNKDRLQRFTQEARTVSNLNHPNILTVYEFGQTDASFFIATEYIDGVTLREHLSSRRLKLIDILDLAIQMVAALNAAHEAGVTHRDLKPENVMVRRDQIVKVLDFGLAKLAATSSDKQIDSEAGTKVFVQTEPGLVMGTVSYMSPEQSTGKGVDQRTDIWSVGVVLYEMLAGCVPFQGKDIHRQIIAIQETEPAPLSQLVEGVPDRLEEIVFKCLAKNKDERYQTAKDLLIDLRNLRRKLDVDAEIERTVAPGLRSTSGTSRASTQGSQLNSGTTSRVQVSTTSSAEYVVTGIKQHKLAAAIVILVLIAGGIGLWLFMRARNTVGAIDSIAVLPFQNKSNAADTEYLSDGLAESLIYRLSQLPNLKVSPTSSVMRYKGKETDVKTIAAELGVSAVMTGRIAQRGDNLTISVELVDVRNNKLLCGEQYERKMSDLLATQREIAAAIAQKLQLKLAGNETRGITKRYTDNNEAYQLYLKGRFHFARRTKVDLDHSIEEFQEAIKLDPNFALAYVGISESYAVMPSYPYMSPKDAMPLAKAAIAKALALDPELPEAHTVSAVIASVYDWDWPTAEREFKRSLELDPNLALTHYRYAWVYLSPMGRHDEAITEMKRAMELEPLSLVQGANFAAVYLYARQFDNALDQAKKTYALDPSFVTGQNWICRAYDAKGMYAESLSISEKTLQTNFPFLADVSYAYAKSGRRQEAEAVLNKWKENEKTKYIMNYWVATTYAALGEKEAAFAELEKAYQAHDWFLARIKTDPFMDPLRDDPRLKDLVRRIGLPE